MFFFCVVFNLKLSEGKRNINNVLVCNHFTGNKFVAYTLFTFFTCPGFNKSAATVVATLLVDNIVWYRSVIEGIQNAKSGQTEGQLLQSVKQDFLNVSCHQAGRQV